MSNIIVFLAIFCILGFSNGDDRFHNVKIRAFLDVCNPRSSGPVSLSSMQVTHKNGPCSPVREKTPSVTRVLNRDRSRVDSIQSKSSSSSVRSDVVIPAKSGISIGSGNFIVTLGLGTPRKPLSLIFDTGSDLTWTQCRPCSGRCYTQKEPLFDPGSSSSYTNVSCKSDTCAEVASAVATSPTCSASTCNYAIQYGDQSFSVGFLGRDRLALSSDTIDGFLFGCGENNQGLFGGAAGLLGLGRRAISAVSQTSQKYGEVFSYCLPSLSTSTGYLSFGGKYPRNISHSYTPMLPGKTFYFVDLIGITVAGHRLAIQPSVFSSGGTIIDSGTVITRLPPAAYSVLRTVFRRYMRRYPSAEAVSILDTCFDMTGYSSATVPKISLVFRGGVELPVDSSGIVYPVSESTVCLAFAGNEGDGSLGIIGNMQQQTVEVVYDVVRGLVGFAPGACP